MTVKEIICDTMRLVGRDDAAQELENDAPSAQTERLQRAFLTYFNAVCDELARGYFPLEKVENMSGSNGRYAFASFSSGPVRICRVTSGRKPVEWHICPDYLIADADNIEVKYQYLPPVYKLTDKFVYPDFAVSGRMVSYGIAAEYFLVGGDGAGYTAWENKYRDEIENLLSKSTVKDRIPPRRWI